MLFSKGWIESGVDGLCIESKRGAVERLRLLPEVSVAAEEGCCRDRYGQRAGEPKSAPEVVCPRLRRDPLREGNAPRGHPRAVSLGRLAVGHHRRRCQRSGVRYPSGLSGDRRRAPSLCRRGLGSSLIAVLITREPQSGSLPRKALIS